MSNLGNVIDIAKCAERVVEHGYVIIPRQVGAAELESLNSAADDALGAIRQALASGIRPAHTELNPYVHAARCFYSWGEACRRLMAHDTIHALAGQLLAGPRLWDMTALEALPLPSGGQLGSFDWHRDFPHLVTGLRPNYLWVFTCLTDVTSDNGATWVIPRSHRDRTIPTPAHGGVSANRPPTAIQLTASAGDMIAMDPTALHAVGENRTHAGRRLALVGLCQDARPPLLDHWRIAHPITEDSPPERIRNLLRQSPVALDGTWDVLPTGWGGGTRCETKTPTGALAGIRRMVRAGMRLVG